MDGKFEKEKEKENRAWKTRFMPGRMRGTTKRVRGSTVQF